jgi:hypothetical protein
LGSFDIEHKESYTGIEGRQIIINDNPHACLPTAQMQLGLRYDKSIRNNTQHIGVGLGFEAQYWWRQNQQIISGELNKKSADVSIHGLTLDIQWGF